MLHTKCCLSCFRTFNKILNLAKFVKEYCLSIQTIIFCALGLVPSSLGLYSVFNSEDIQLNDQIYTIFKAFIALSLGFSIIVSDFLLNLNIILSR